MAAIKDWLLKQRDGSVGPTVGSEVVVNGSNSGGKKPVTSLPDVPYAEGLSGNGTQGGATGGGGTGNATGGDGGESATDGSGPTSTPSYVTTAEEIKSTATETAKNVHETAVGTANSNYASYAEFLTGNKNTAYGNAEQIRAEAEKVAETNRQRGVIDAQASFDFNKATYGQNAEALRSMGLTGSGYADYLTSRAYATQRAEAQGANAQAAAAKREAADAEAKAKLAADATYNEGLFQATITRDNNIAAADAALNSTLADIEESYQSNILSGKDKADATFATLLDSANTGNYTAEALAEIARNAGCTDEQISLIGEAVSAANTKKNAKAYADYFELAKSGDHTIDELNALMNNTNLTYNQKESIISAATDVAKAGKSAVQEANYQQFLSQLDAGELDFGTVNQAYLRQDISGAQLKELKEAYRDRIDTTENVYIANGEYLPYNDAKAALDTALSDPWLDTSTKTKLRSTFDSIYGGVITSNIKFYDGNAKGKENGNIKLMDTKTNIAYRVDYGAAVDLGTNPKMKAATASLPNGSVFRYGDGNTLYIKVSNDKVCAIKARPATGGDDYNLLWKAILG